MPFLVHATEVVTNVRFWDLAVRWDELEGWQRGVLGIAIVLVAEFAILWAAFSFGMHAGGGPGARG